MNPTQSPDSFNLTCPISNVKISKNAMTALVELCAKYRKNISVAAGVALNQALLGQTKIAYAAGTSASLNAIRRALLNQPMGLLDLTRITTFSHMTIRTGTARLEGCGEVVRSRSVTMTAGRPFDIYALTERGQQACQESSLEPLEGTITREVIDETQTPRFRIKQFFIEKPTKEWTIADMINETHHAPMTVKSAFQQLAGAKTIVNGNPRRGHGRAAATFKLNPAYRAEFDSKPIEPEPFTEPVAAPVNAPEESEYEEHTCGVFDLNAYKAAVEAKKAAK